MSYRCAAPVSYETENEEEREFMSEFQIQDVSYHLLGFRLSIK